MTSNEHCRAGLQAIATELRAALAEGLGPDQQAYAALVRADEVHPWTKEAEALWVRASGSDPWRDHHLAILHHDRAYDLETTGSAEAFQYWKAALRHWAAVHADNAFWARMTRHLSERMGSEVAPGVVEGVRARLPRELLQPHRDLIAAYQTSNPERARNHMRVLTSAPFDPDVIDGIRLQFTEGVVAAVPDAIRTTEFDAMIASLRGWHHIDERNAHLLRSLLRVYGKFNEHVWGADDGLTRVAENVAAAAQLLTDFGVPPPDPAGVAGDVGRPMTMRDSAGVAGYVDRLLALRPGGLPPDALTTEIARHEVWGGLVSSRLASKRFSWEASPGSRQECERGLAGAVGHFAMARRLDPHLALDSYYSALPSIEADTESMWGLCLMAKRDFIGAAQHCRRATTLDPSDADCFCGLAQALLMSDTVTGAALAEAEQAISRADALSKASGDKRRSEVGKLRELLGVRRRQNL